MTFHFNRNLRGDDGTAGRDDTAAGGNDGILALGAGDGRIPAEGLILSDDARGGEVDAVIARNITDGLSELMIPLLIFYIVLMGIFGKKNVYEDFMRGAKD